MIVLLAPALKVKEEGLIEIDPPIGSNVSSMVIEPEPLDAETVKDELVTTGVLNLGISIDLVVG